MIARRWCPRRMSGLEAFRLRLVSVTVRVYANSSEWLPAHHSLRAWQAKIGAIVRDRAAGQMHSDNIQIASACGGGKPTPSKARAAPVASTFGHGSRSLRECASWQSHRP